jgi:hypothetical protein
MYDRQMRFFAPKVTLSTNPAEPLPLLASFLLTNLTTFSASVHSASEIHGRCLGPEHQ